MLREQEADRCSYPPRGETRMVRGDTGCSQGHRRRSLVPDVDGHCCPRAPDAFLRPGDRLRRHDQARGLRFPDSDLAEQGRHRPFTVLFVEKIKPCDFRAGAGQITNFERPSIGIAPAAVTPDVETGMTRRPELGSLHTGVIAGRERCSRWWIDDKGPVRPGCATRGRDVDPRRRQSSGDGRVRRIELLGRSAADVVPGLGEHRDHHVRCTTRDGSSMR